MKTKLKYIITLSIVSFAILFNMKRSAEIQTRDLLMSNVEALANGEVDVEALCMVDKINICIVYSDGYFLRGRNLL